MNYFLRRLKEILSNKKTRYLLIGVAVLFLLTSVFQQESNKIEFSTKPVYEVFRDTSNTNQNTGGTTGTTAEFEVDTPETTPAPVISSTGMAYDTYYNFSGVVSSEVSAAEIGKLNLPIVIQNIPTNSGVQNLGARLSNPYYSDQSVLIIEISGPNYFTAKPVNMQNPNVVAFRDAFVYVRNELSQKYGVDLLKTRFTFGTRADEVGTGIAWLNFLRLIP